MTESEIMKALECRNEDIICAVTDKDNNTYFVYNRDVIDLINRKNADIERLITCRKEEVEKLVFATDKVIAEARSEAIKELAERVKSVLSLEKRKCRKWLDNDGAFMVDKVRKEVDNLLKEMGVEL